ncbi:energy transducer TonB [Cytophagaceae bacterium DM2B3-1]|uniref:Energy transducer TonB n=1 Tax=Xanthocytophaga flava TaxID=3048013 RepID=A0ABT7CE94_9BACT|nr:energy transducer TonB [Xanthocytophaga flavus]MDJ1492031.1 energy transducer TonB [Xanthocytophaga flavus]
MIFIKEAWLLLWLFFLWTTAFTQSYPKKLIAQLDTIIQADQQYRSVAARQSAKTPEEEAIQMRKQSAIDITNMAKIDKIIAEYGYPGKSLVGEKYQSVALMVIQHNDPAAREKYLPLLIEAAGKGEVNASSVAIVIDRAKIDKGEKQIYGSQLNETKQGVKLMPIEDEPNVNVRRAKVGLPPLEVYLKQWNMNYKLPTTTNPNPAEWYYVPEARSESAVELIGGDKALYSKLLYPAKAKENNISGFVTIELTIDKNGIPKNPIVVKSLGYGCDEEALRVIKEARFTNTSGEEAEMRIRLPFPYVK